LPPFSALPSSVQVLRPCPHQADRAAHPLPLSRHPSQGFRREPRRKVRALRPLPCPSPVQQAAHQPRPCHLASCTTGRPSPRSPTRRAWAREFPLPSALPPFRSLVPPTSGSVDPERLGEKLVEFLIMFADEARRRGGRSLTTHIGGAPIARAQIGRAHV